MEKRIIGQRVLSYAVRQLLAIFILCCAFAVFVYANGDGSGEGTAWPDYNGEYLPIQSSPFITPATAIVFLCGDEGGSVQFSFKDGFDVTYEGKCQPTEAAEAFFEFLKYYHIATCPCEKK